MTHYELRDHPDDLPIICRTLDQAARRANRRAERMGIPVLVYEVSERGERFIGEAEG
jgi:hypothetical protein